MSEPPPNTAARWRLALGRHADDQLSKAGLGGRERRMATALEGLYGRAHAGRGFRPGRGGGLDPSKFVVPSWLDEMRRLFPESVFETVQGHAIERFDMGELLANAEALKRLTPNIELMKVLLAFKGGADPSVAEPIREVVKKVVEELRKKLEKEIARAFSGSRNRFATSQQKRMVNFDARATIRANLKSYQPDRKALIAETLRFNARQKRKIPWTVILCVDQSGSMLGSVIHAAVLASILASLPSIEVKLVVFDTNVVDLTDRVEDPVDVLLSVQLGGGTQIGKAVEYCEGLVTQPTRTVLALISDFEEGDTPEKLVRAVRRLAEARVTQIGLAALDDATTPVYDRAMAARLADAGMHIAALTPDRFAEWLAGVMT